MVVCCVLWFNGFSLSFHGLEFLFVRTFVFGEARNPAKPSFLIGLELLFNDEDVLFALLKPLNLLIVGICNLNMYDITFTGLCGSRLFKGKE